MTPVLPTLMLALVWVAATGRLTILDFLVGYGLGFLALRILGPSVASGRWGWRTWKVVPLLLFFLKEVLVSGLRVALDVVAPHPGITAGVVAVPLELESEMEIAVLANMITLTPGTLSLDVAPDRSTLYVHSLYAEDPDEVRRSVKEGFERRILEVSR